MAASSDELVQAVLREDADVVLVHEDLGPEPALLAARATSASGAPPARCCSWPPTPTPTWSPRRWRPAPAAWSQLPLSFGQLEGRLLAAATWSRPDAPAAVQRADRRRRRAARTGRARVVLLAGAKGGVGHHHRGHPPRPRRRAQRVPRSTSASSTSTWRRATCPGVLEVRHRIGVSDLAKVADDLSPGTIADAVTQHASGRRPAAGPAGHPRRRGRHPAGPAPGGGGAAPPVRPRPRRRRLARHPGPGHRDRARRRGRASSSPRTSPSLRGMRRDHQRLGVPRRVQGDRRPRAGQPDLQAGDGVHGDRAPAHPAPRSCPSGCSRRFRRLEPALNARDPLELRNRQWWDDLRQVGSEVGLVPADPGGPAQGRGRGRRGRRRTRRSAGGRRGRRAARRRRRRRGRRAPSPSSRSPCSRCSAPSPPWCWHMAMIGGALVLQSNAAAAAAARRTPSRPPSARRARRPQDALPGLHAPATSTSTPVERDRHG